jgi:predicted RNA-binding Zn-ribbon protein involved in translation (DUF1610 family)
MEQMSSNNTFNTSAARGYLDDLKTRVGQLKTTLDSKTRLNKINWNSTVHLQLKNILESEFAPQINNIHARVIHFENDFLAETSNFVKDHKSLIRKANESFEQINVLENNDSLFEVVLSTDIMSIILQTYSVQDDERLIAETSAIVSKYENALIKLEKENVSYFKQLDRKTEECKYDKLSYERAYTDMQKQNDLLRAQLESLKKKGVDTKFTKPSSLEKPNASKTVEKPNMPISRFAPKVVEKKDFTKPVTPHSLPIKKSILKTDEKIVEKQKLVVERNTNVIAPGFSRNSTRNVTTKTIKEYVGSNDMFHNHHIEEARKKAQLRKDGILGAKPSVMNSTRFQSTASSSKPLPRNNQQNTREWLASKSSCTKENARHVECNTKNYNSSLNKKQFPNDCSDKVKVTVLNKNAEFVCPTCKKRVFSANHDACVAQYIEKENSRAKVQSTKTPKRNKPVDKKQEAKKPNRWISTGRSFSQNKTSAVSEKKTTPRSCLRWTPTGKVFNTIGLRWIPTGKIFVTGKVFNTI